MRKHALLSPSGAHRWLVCSPSALLESKIADSSSRYADEGTLAHSLGELLIKQFLGLITDTEFDIEFYKIENDELYEDDMYSYCLDYAYFVIGLFNELRSTDKNAQIFLEQKLDLTDYIPDGFGTTDICMCGGDWLYKVDFKYGQGVSVDAVENEQLMTYALGAAKMLEPLFDISRVRMVIYQPRLNNISEFYLSLDDLQEWGLTVLKPGAAKAFKGEGEFVPGHHCKFCRVKTRCEALKKFAMDSLNTANIPGLIDDKEVSKVLAKADIIVDYINAVKKYALTEAVDNNKKWEGFKLVQGRSNRKIVNEEQAIGYLMSLKYDYDKITKTKIRGIGELEKVIGKKNFESTLQGFIIKPPGKPTLAPISDIRLEWSPSAEAFKDIKIEDDETD